MAYLHRQNDSYRTINSNSAWMPLENIGPGYHGPGRQVHDSNESRQELLGSEPQSRSVPAGSSVQIYPTHDDSNIGPTVPQYDANALFYHRDIFKRSYQGRRDDRLLNPRDGRPTKLTVQCSNAVLNPNNISNATWERNTIRNRSPWMFRLSSWATENYAYWIPACFALSIVLLNPMPVTVRDNGFFEPFPYKDWQYPYDARNVHENIPRKESQSKFSPDERGTSFTRQTAIGKIERLTEPTYLFWHGRDSTGRELWHRINVQEWKQKQGSGARLEYIFVSYTSSQFSSDDDKRYLHRVGQAAAEAANVPAYWIGLSCLGTGREQELNVWRICDVVPKAHSLVIVVGRNAGSTVTKSPQDLVHEWGSRVWTLPELLLTTNRQAIKIYLADDKRKEINLQDPVNFRNFEQYWPNDANLGQLIDHYEGTVILSPLEFLTTALLCLQGRSTSEHLPGDLSYSLMGLLRQRPDVRRSDSAFQAFARLSLANDSNMLLERMICLLPENVYQPWHSLQDYWGASLWDIYPKTQICGIGENDTIILDGARAASIRWKSFKRVITRHRDTFRRKAARVALTCCAPFLFFGILMVAIARATLGGSEYSYYSSAAGISSPLNALLGVGIVFLVIGVLFILLSPLLIKWLYHGKVWSAQPYFFGVEGYMPLPDLERTLFGANLGRLSWSTTGSSISRHDLETSPPNPTPTPIPYQKLDFCEGKDPSVYPDIKAKIQAALHSSRDEEKVFMLVDTYTLTVTMFLAVKPPVAVLMCGEEGGMQRALLCSYEWTRNTLYRETVLRMETRAYWRMGPVGRVRLGLGSRRGVDV